MIELLGHFNAELGVGEVARRLANLLAAAGLDVKTTSLTNVASRQGVEFSLNTGDIADKPAALVVCVNPDQLGQLYANKSLNLSTRVKTIGFWSWELEAFPKLLTPAFSFVDEVWTVSDFARNSIQARTNKKVRHIKLPSIEPSITELRATFEHPGINNDDFLVLASFDFFSGFERKNPVAAIEAFKLAFPKVGEAKLLVKSINGERFERESALLKRAAGNRTDIIFSDGYLNPVMTGALMSRADVYVSLHRAEGLGLNIFDAIALGTPVIATGYSGNTDFLRFEGAGNVPFKMRQVGFYAGMFHGCVWAEPNVEIAAIKLRELFESPDLREDVATNGTRFINENYSYEAAIRHLEKELELE